MDLAIRPFVSGGIRLGESDHLVAKELGADAIIVLSHGTEYAGTISSGSAFTSGQFYGNGFNATTIGTLFFCAFGLR
jgi:hypothetical protein